MKLASLAFLLLLLHAHGEVETDDPLALPLSMFRDGAHGWLGYALFAVLLTIGGLYARALARSRKEVEAGLAGCAVLLLLVVAVTASVGELHVLCSLVLLALLYGYCAVVLYHAGSPWLVGHLAVPVLLALATGFHSYGAWQKSFIAYCVLAVTLHHHLLGHPPASSGTALPGATPSRRGRLPRRCKVYPVEPGRAWARRGW
jgi:hypothetical protein